MSKIHRGKANVQWVFKHDATGACGTAFWKTPDGCEMAVCFKIPQEKLARVWKHLSEKSPYGADEIGFFKRIRKAVSKGVLRQVVSAVKQATLIPQAMKLATAVQRATGIPVGPEQISKAYDLAVAAATKNPEAIRKIASLGRMAAIGNPLAVAALTGLKAVSSYVPAVRKVAEPIVGAEYGYGYPYGAGAPQFGSNIHALPRVATC